MSDNGTIYPKPLRRKGEKGGAVETNSDIDKKSSTFSMIQGETYKQNSVKFRKLTTNIDSNI
uniref:Uncharacterized protein n=1 Tax=Solanum tuberosum TaxID=4113 RepID=M1CZ00_SOLTU